MVNHENDLLAAAIREHERVVDCFYVLDGTVPNDYSRWVCESSEKCAGYWTDGELPRPPYTPDARDGYRQFLYEHAITDHGHDNWFLLLHADEIWKQHPSGIVAAYPNHDGFGFLLPFFVPRERDGWDDRHPFAQLRWMLGPGWPEFRMFHGNPDVAYDPGQHFNVTPSGLRNIAMTPNLIYHYPYRSPAVQAERAAVTFDPDNYRHTGLWSDARIDECLHSNPHAALLMEVG